MDLYELMGIIIGDGSILYSKDKHVYRLEIVGNANDDVIFFKEISEFIEKEFGIKSKIIIKRQKNGKAIRLYINNKKFVENLLKITGLPYGNKTYTVEIPKKYLNWKYSRHILRGIFESDGCIFFSKSKVFKYPTYPRIEIRSASKGLVNQIDKILTGKGYKVNILLPKNEKAYKIYLSGDKMLERWVKEIGISNIKNTTKYLFWKKYGYYIPKMALSQRLSSLNGRIAKR